MMCQCDVSMGTTLRFKQNFFYCWTNLGPILVELFVEHIIRPQCCKSLILEDLTNIYIIGLTITL